ncbi:MAG TPA: hypothetical protein VF017_18035 [Thermoanaerobaculia bacterium]|nr:hypothetical protein [Thermoanaerobaculia bacterium]
MDPRLRGDDGQGGSSQRNGDSGRLAVRATLLLAGAVLLASASSLPAQIFLLDNGPLEVEIREDNGAIHAVRFNSREYFRIFTHVSDWGLQLGGNTATFALNGSDGLEGVPVSITAAGSGVVTAAGTYTLGGANVAVERRYDLVPGQDALRIITRLTNNGFAPVTLRGFDTFDPDQGVDGGVGVATFNDVEVQPTPGGTVRVGLAYPPVEGAGVQYASALCAPASHSVDAGGPFQIGSGSELNSVFTTPVDGAGALEDLGTHHAYEVTLFAGVTRTATVVLGFGLSPTSARNAALSRCGEVDLRVEKTGSPATVVAGSGPQNFSYLARVTNRSTRGVTGLVLDDFQSSLPGVTVDSITPSPGTTFSGTAWTVGTLPAGESRTLSLVLTAGPSAPGGVSFSNFINVAGLDQHRVLTGDDAAESLVSIVRRVDLVVTKTESVDPVAAGSGANNLTYAITVANNGPSDASGVVISDALTMPTGVGLTAIASSPGTTVTAIGPPLVLSWNVGTLPRGQSRFLNLGLTVGADAATGTDTVGDVVSIGAVNEPRINTGDDGATVFTSVRRLLELVVTQSESVDPVVAGSGPGNLTYVVTVTNNGPVVANGLQLSEILSLPAGVTLDAAVPSGGTTFTSPVWNVGTLGVGQSRTLTLVLSVGPSAANGTSVIASSAAVIAVDETPANSSTLAVSHLTSIVRQVDLVVTKTESVDPVAAGSGANNLTYAITVANNGPSDASGLVLSDLMTMPTGVGITSIASSPGTTVTAIGPPIVLSWDVGTLPRGQSRFLNLGLTVGPDTAIGTDTVGDVVSVGAINETLVNTGDDSKSVFTSVRRLLDLVVTQSESVDPVIAGSGPGNLTYVVTVTNNGPVSANGLQLSEILSLPAGVTLDAAVPSGGTTFTSPVWNLGTLGVGASRTLTLVLSVGPSAANGTAVIASSAAVIALEETPTSTSTLSAAHLTSIQRRPDLSVTKVDLVDPVAAGSTLTYNLTVANAGPSDATAATVSDTLPSALTLTSVTPSQGTCAPTTTAFTCSLGVLAAGGNASIVLQTTVSSSAAGTVTNTATVAAGTGDVDPAAANNSSQAFTTVLGQANLVLTKADAPDPVVAGNSLVYTLTATNNGPGEATGVVLTDPLPGVLTLISSSPPGLCSSSAGTVSCALGTLAPGASRQIELTAALSLSASGTLTNVATLIGQQADPTPADNTATALTTVGPPVDLEVTIVDTPDPVPVGDTLLYTVTVVNHGPATATGVQLLDTVPAGLTLVSAVPGQGACSPAGNVIPCALGSLTNGQSVTVFVSTTVGAAAVGQISNTATVSSEALDREPANDSATALTTVTAVADLGVTLVDAPDPLGVGEQLTFTATVSNSGPATGLATTFATSLPAGLTLLSAVPTQGSCTPSGASVSCNLGSLANGLSAMVVLQASVASTAPASLVTTVTVSGAGSDPNAANDSATATTTVNLLADLALTLADSPDPVGAGGTLTYQLGVTNAGPAQAPGVVVTLDLESGLLLLSSPSLAPEALIFADGFESGDFSAWTSVVGLPFVGGSGCTQSGSVVTCPLGTLAAGASVQRSVPVLVSQTASGSLVANASVVSGVADPVATNDSASTSTAVSRSVDLALSVTDSPDPVSPGGEVTYVWTVTNTGAAADSGVMLTDPLPPELSLLSATPSQGSCAGSSLVVCNLGVIAGGSSASVVVSAAVALSAVGALTNTASVDGVQLDPNLVNNTATAVTGVGFSLGPAPER